MILRTIHKSNYTVLVNEMLMDKTISFKARGLLSYMLSLPNDWIFYQSELESHSELDGDTAIRSAVNELITAGYVTRQQAKNKEGKWKESEWEVREIPQRGKPHAGNPIPGNQPLLSTKKKLSTNNKKHFLQKSSFDPEELPGHFIKHPTVITSWIEFVQHRKETGHKLTPLAHKKITMEMLQHTPDEIVEAINMAITKGWRGLFYKNGSTGNKSTISKPDTTTLGPDAKRLYDFTVKILGDQLVRKQEVAFLIATMEIYHTTLGSKFPNCVKHLNWDKFFGDWLKYLQEKQPTFPLQGAYQLKIGGLRWSEFIQRCEHYTQYSFKTGKFQL